jgi:hypothetical protein
MATNDGKPEPDLGSAPPTALYVSPRGGAIEKMVPEERLLFSAATAIAKMGEDATLTAASVKIAEARDLVAKFVDDRAIAEGKPPVHAAAANASSDTPQSQEVDPEFMKKRRLGLI